MRKCACVIGITFALAACNGAKSPDSTTATDNAAATGADESSSASSAPVASAAQYKEVTIPAGTTLRLDLSTAVASDTSDVEQPVTATLRSPVSIDGQVVLPTGSEVTGVVTQAAGSGRVKGRARIAMRFSRLRTRGDSYDIKTSGYAQEAAATKKKDATKIAVGAGAGAALGAILGGGSGAAKGAAVGGAAGTGVVLATKGDEVRLGPGANITTRLTAPLTVRVRS